MRKLLVSTLFFCSLSQISPAVAQPAPQTDLSLLSYFQALYPLISTASRAAEEEGMPIVEPGRLWLRVYQPPFLSYPVARAIRRVLDHVQYQLYPANREATLVPDLQNGNMLVRLPPGRADAVHFVYVTWRFVL